MADEIGQYANYPTYPGYGPWIITNYESGVTEDYRIDERNVPTGSVATRLDIFSSEFKFNEYFGVIIALPSLILSGASYRTLITLRGRYRTWLNTGRAVTISTTVGSDTTGIRPPTFHYQYLDRYKEVVHYGFDLILLALVFPTGAAEIISLESFYAFLEHRHQCRFGQATINQETVASVEIQKDEKKLRVMPNYSSEVSLGKNSSIAASGTFWVLSAAEDNEAGNEESEEATAAEESVEKAAGHKEYDKKSLVLEEIEKDGTLVFGLSDEDIEKIEEDTFPNLAGAFFQLNRGVQITDPAMLYSEIKRDGAYWQQKQLGYETREQSLLESVDVFSSVYYDEAAVAASIEGQRVRLLETALNSEDTAEVQKAQEEFLQLTADQRAVESKNSVFNDLDEAAKGEEVTVKVGTFEEEAKILQDEREADTAATEAASTAAATAAAAASVAAASASGAIGAAAASAATASAAAADEETEGAGGTDVTVRLDSVVLREFSALEVSTVYVKADIDGATLSRNNFHAGTQVGNFMIASVPQPEAEADPFSEPSTHAYSVLGHPRNKIFLLSRTSSTSSLDLLDILGLEQQNFSMRSSRFWTVADIMTSRSAGSTGFNAGFMHSEVLDVGPWDKADNVWRVTVALRDESYYSPEEIRRWLDDPENDVDISGKAWTKFANWEFRKFGSERTDNYAVKSVSEVDPAEMLRVYNSTKTGYDIILADPLPEGAAAKDFPGEWWIGFEPVIAMSPSSLSYTGTPFLGLNAFLGRDDTPPSGPTLTFDGIYVGSPLSLSLPQDAVLSLIEDNPVIFPNAGGVDFSPIWVSSIRDFKYLAYSLDTARDAEFVLYNRDDDDSNALYVRQGRLDWLYDINEFLVHLGDLENIQGEKTSGDGASVQVVQAPSEIGDRDIISIVTRKADPDERPEKVAGSWLNTIWRVYQGDRLLGHKLTSDKENSILTRSKGDGTVTSDVLPYYHTAEYFSEDRGVFHDIPGNRETGDPLAGDGRRYRFVPVQHQDAKHASFTEVVQFEVADENKTIRDVQSQAVYPFIGGQRIVLVVQPQNSYVDGDGSGGSFKIVSGTEGSKDSINEPPSSDSVTPSERGVFLMTTTNDFRQFSGGIFYRPSPPPSATGVTKNTLYRYPHLVGPDMFSCSYAMRDNLLDIVGYSKVTDSNGAEVFCIIHYTVNLALAYRRPVFTYEAGGEVLFTYSKIRRPRNIVVRAATTDEIDTGYLYDGLEENPLALAADKAFSILIFQKGANLMFAISTVEGKKWSYYDDIELVSGQTRVAAPQAEIIGSELFLFYIVDKEALWFKKIPIPDLVKFHNRYANNKKSSDEQDEDVNKVKKDFQAFLDNIESVRIATTFEQQVAFGLNRRRQMHVVFFDRDGLVNSASSTTGGSSWNTSPVNF